MTELREKPAARPTAVPFVAVAVGIMVDTVLLYSLLRIGVAVGTAGMVSLPVAAIAIFLLRNGAGAVRTPGTDPIRIGRFTLIVMLTVFLRGGILAWLERIPGIPVFLVAGVAGVATGLLLRAAVVVDTGPASDGSRHAWSWRNPVVALLVYAVLLRWVYFGLPELIHEEAYYWNYSRHLSLSYLDHPPIVAWTIRLFTEAFGHTEFGVRAGAFVWWLVGAWFVSRLARRVFDSATAACAVLLFAVFPAYYGFGWLMTPDSSLTACWAGALYFAYRALIDEDSAAWFGFGVCLGVGLLSKYTMVLVGAGVFAFMVVDSSARRWFRRPSPYAAAGIALLLFAPVILWNIQNDWASFAFQGPRRVGGSYEFSLPALLGAAAALLTPVGFVAAVVTVFSRKQLTPAEDRDRRERFKRGFLLLILSMAVPFSVFVAFSLFRHTKVNWTGPVWLGVLPFLGHMMATPWRDDAGRFRTWLSPRTFRTTAIVMLLIYGLGMHYLVLGLWGVRYPVNHIGLSALGWDRLAVKIETVVDEVEQETGRRPLIVGMDVGRMSSLLAFYRSRAIAARDGTENTGAAVFDTAGPDLFGRESHMYRMWFQEARQDSERPWLLVGDEREQLDVDSNRKWSGPIQELTTEKNGWTTWHVYYRVLR